MKDERVVTMDVEGHNFSFKSLTSKSTLSPFIPILCS